MPGRSQRAQRTKLLALCALIGCGSSADPEEHADGSTAPAASAEQISYSFSASRRTSEPSACGAYQLDMQLVFEDDLHKVTAVISNQAWACELHADASTYDITCTSPRNEAAAVEAALMIVLFEAAPRARIAGEATLTISTTSGSCEHSYALDGTLDS